MFEWVLGNIDGKSISISGKHGTVTLKPITREFLEQVPNIAELSDEELEAIDALKENIENLLSNNYDLLYCETYDRYSDLFDKLKVDYEIFNIEVNSGKPYRFQFFADDEFTLASYALAFQIALGLDDIKDVSYYYKKERVIDLDSHDKNKMLLTVITLNDGRQIALCPQNDGLEMLLGKMKILKKYILFVYGDGESVIEWVHDEIYGTYDISETTPYEWEMWGGDDDEDEDEEIDYDEDEDEDDDEEY